MEGSRLSTLEAMKYFADLECSHMTMIGND